MGKPPAKPPAATPKKKTAKADNRPKETIAIPKKSTMPDASRQLRKGHPSGARSMADMSVAKQEGLTKKKAAAKPALPTPKKPKGKNDPAF